MRSDRRSGRVDSTGQILPGQSRFRLDKAPDYSRSPLSGSRLSQRRLAELAGELSERDRAVLAALRTAGVLSGSQLERLGFTDIAASARGRIRRRVLGRLVTVGLAVTLERRVGGVRAGSAGLLYVPSGAGQRLLGDESEGRSARYRTPATPGPLFLAHALAVSEIFVSTVEAVRRLPDVWLETFRVEADARWPTGDGAGDVLRPDALAVLSRGNVEDVWWLEVDRGTESRPRLTAMLQRYLDFAGSGEAGPRGVVPRVLVSVVDGRRLRIVRSLAGRLPEPAGELFVVCREGDVADRLLHELVGESALEPP